MTLRMLALALAVVLAIPPPWPCCSGRAAATGPRARRWLSLDGLWTVVPLALLAALIALAAAA